MSTVAIIPARYASTRLPGKPLLAETGRPLIQHVYERIAGVAGIDRAIVATDDERILAAVKAFSGEVVLTRSDHETGTDRIAEVAANLDAEWVLNVQGDEPEIETNHLTALIERMKGGAQMGTLACPFAQADDADDPNAVKVVVSENGHALYFSRARIPYARDASFAVTPLLHVGVYAYRRDFLLEYARMPQSPLERCEKLEQLRALENGIAIDVVTVSHATAGIDTPEDYAAFVERDLLRNRG